MESIQDTQNQIKFLLNIQRLLVEGQFTATYKDALLLAIADISVERGHDDNRELTISVDEIAQKFIHYYWDHSMPFREEVLKSATGQQARVVSILAERRQQFATLSALKRSSLWRSTVREVAATIKLQPLWKLQTIGGQSFDFIYPNQMSGDKIILRKGICYSFRLFYGLTTEIIRSGWIDFVRRNPENQRLIGQHGDLEQFLFGESRNSLQNFREPLIELQGRRCFYCERTLPNQCDVDHFIPWSIYKNDLGHNFVVASKGCNADKSSRIASIGHLGKWLKRNDEKGNHLISIFAEKNINYDLSTSLKVAEHAYHQAEIGRSNLWVRPRGVVEPIAENWRGLIYPYLPDESCP